MSKSDGLTPADRDRMLSHMGRVREMERLTMEQLSSIRRELKRCNDLLNGLPPTETPEEKMGFVVWKGGRQ